MSTRVRVGLIVAGAIVVTLFLIGLLAGGSTGSAKRAAAPPATTAPAAKATETRALTADSVPFTLQVPKSYGKRTATDTDVLVAVRPSGANGIGIRRDGTVEGTVTDDDLESTVRRQLAADGSAVPVRRDTIGGRTVVSFVTTETQDREVVENIHHVFIVGDTLWEIGCESTAKSRQEIQRACDEAIASVVLK